MGIDWFSKLRHGVQTLAFCLVIATLQYAFQPDKPYGPPMVFSILIGMSIWVLIDIGRELMPSSAETGWPKGFWGLGLVAGGIVGGWGFGNFVGDRLCRLWNLFPPGTVPPDPNADLRSSVLITVMAGAVGSYYFYSSNKSAYLARKMGETRRQADEARLKLLETQLEPHMLFNTLANLRALIAVDPSRAQVMLDHMIAYLRATLDASRATTHPLETEFARLRDYLELMSIRMGPRLQFTLDLPPALASQPVPSLVLQPLVENAVKHGLEPKVEGGHITVSARREGGDLVLEVADTGIGPGGAPGLGKDRPGFGMHHVRERLATLHGAAASFDFAGAPEGGSRAVLRLPVHA